MTFTYILMNATVLFVGEIIILNTIYRCMNSLCTAAGPAHAHSQTTWLLHAPLATRDKRRVHVE